MNGRQIGSGIVAGLAMFLLSGIYHTVLLADVFAAQEVAEPNMVTIGCAFVLLGLLMAYMYPKGYGGGAAVGEGARFGALIGLLWILPLSIVLVGTGTLTWGVLMWDFPYHVVEGAIGGIILAKMHRPGA